ncbi:BCL2/adenovirus E1B 19 kDa protein-interacting protein 3 isoform X2 [Armigeres subalbatus]|uniref:BCL2/adenovirus E1B 19 kDa protein-interacting protein 3 isoform X2 n=1 Tax=Armigeres subalbatus TaxID=124917 RepID=UPI002ED4E9BC
MFKSINLTSEPNKMSATARYSEDLLGESWIELSSSTNTGPKSPDRTTPLPFTSVEEYQRLLREAQRESKESSRVTSLTSSRRDSPRGSPKSPPNSPNTELATTEEELRGVYINYLNRVDVIPTGDLIGHAIFSYFLLRLEAYAKQIEAHEPQLNQTAQEGAPALAQNDNEWVWEWSSRPDQLPPKDWKFEHPKHGVRRMQQGYSMRLTRVGKNSLFSREVLYSLVLTNVLSLLLGAGLGAWLHKRGLLFTRISIE